MWVCLCKCIMYVHTSSNSEIPRAQRMTTNASWGEKLWDVRYLEKVKVTGDGDKSMANINSKSCKPLQLHDLYQCPTGTKDGSTSVDRYFTRFWSRFWKTGIPYGTLYRQSKIKNIISHNLINIVKVERKYDIQHNLTSCAVRRADETSRRIALFHQATVWRHCYITLSFLHIACGIHEKKPYSISCTVWNITYVPRIVAYMGK